MKKVYGYGRAVLLSVIAALAIDMAMNAEAYKAGMASILKHEKAADYTVEAPTPKKFRLINVPSVRLLEF